MNSSPPGQRHNKNTHCSPTRSHMDSLGAGLPPPVHRRAQRTVSDTDMDRDGAGNPHTHTHSGEGAHTAPRKQHTHSQQQEETAWRRSVCAGVRQHHEISATELPNSPLYTLFIPSPGSVSYLLTCTGRGFKMLFNLLFSELHQWITKTQRM